MKSLDRAYNDQMDVGTSQFAVYYKKWIKLGAEAPLVPSVTLPSVSLSRSMYVSGILFSWHLIFIYLFGIYLNNSYS